MPRQCLWRASTMRAARRVKQAYAPAHTTPLPPAPPPIQISVPDPAEERRIINCAMPPPTSPPLPPTPSHTDQRARPSQGAAHHKLCHAPTPHPRRLPCPPMQIAVPDPAKERRIINCAMPYVDCGNAELYGLCCRD